MDEFPADGAIVWLGEADCNEPASVGPKAAQLSALAAHHRVPDGFCLTAEAYRSARPGGQLGATLRTSLSAAYERLRGGADEGDTYVAVRSSAVDEDGAEASFAGQHDTLLNVRGAEAVAAAVASIWASLRSETALAYRRQRSLDDDHLALAVLVQRMVWADVAGVAFSLDPVTGTRERIVVSANWGLGESVVAGTVTADTWHLDKRDLRVLDANLADKERMVIPSDSGTRDAKVPTFLRTRPSLSDSELTRVADLTRALERERGWPVDIEFAWRGGELWLLQCRPITALGTHA